MHLDLIYLVLFPIVCGVVFLLLPKRMLQMGAICMQSIMLMGALAQFKLIRSSGTLIQNIGGWRNYLGITLQADLIAIVLTMLATVLFFCIFLFSFEREYMTSNFFFLLAVLQGLIIGIFFSNDLFNIFVLVEVATMVISQLIMYRKDSRAIYDGFLYLMVNVVAMCLFLFGIGMLYKTVGIVQLNGIRDVLLERSDASAVIVPYALIITAICLKSAIMPLFSWLPKAHGTPSAPTAVSALLSGLYVKCGIYLFIRVQHAFAPVLDTAPLFLMLGFITAVAGFMLAISQKDIKLILAYHTVSQIGLIMIGLNMGSDQAFMGSVYHIISHAMFKSTLFFTAGLIIDAYKTRNVYEIRGVFRQMPWVAVAAILAILGITGAPFFNGSISKYFIAHATEGSWMEYALLLVNLGTVLSFVKYGQMFFGKPQHKSPTPSRLRQGIVLSMGIACFLGGFFGQPILNYLFHVEFSIDTAAYMYKSVTYGITVALGFVLYRYVLKRFDLTRIANAFDFSFQGVCGSMGAFLFGLLAYLRFFI